jgi:hypothetical protein
MVGTPTARRWLRRSHPRGHRPAPPTRVAWLVALGLAALLLPEVLVPARAGALSLSVSANPTSVTPGSVLTISMSAAQSATPGTVDFYAGVLAPDGNTIVFFSDLAFHLGLASLSNVAPLHPILAGVEVSQPFAFNTPQTFTYTWTGNEPAGTYIAFFIALVPSALSDGIVQGGEVVAAASAQFAYTPGLQLTGLSSTSASPGQPLVLTGTAFNPAAQPSVRFFDEQGYSVEIGAALVQPTFLIVIVPPYVDVSTHQFGPGTVSVQVAQSGGTAVSNILPGLAIGSPPALTLPPGSVAANFVGMMVLFLQDVDGVLAELETASGGQAQTGSLRSKLSALRTDLATLESQIRAAIANPGSPPTIGTFAGSPIVLDPATLRLADQWLLAILDATFGGAPVSAAASLAGPISRGIVPCTGSGQTLSNTVGQQPNSDAAAKARLIDVLRECRNDLALLGAFWGAGGAAGLWFASSMAAAVGAEVPLGLMLIAAAPPVALLAASLGLGLVIVGVSVDPAAAQQLLDQFNKFLQEIFLLSPFSAVLGLLSPGGSAAFDIVRNGQEILQTEFPTVYTRIVNFLGTLVPPPPPGCGALVTTVPAHPAPFQDYTVTIQIACAPPGAVVTISISGTDGYSDSTSCVVDSSGRATCQLAVPGAAAGVVDTVTVQIPGFAPQTIVISF